MTPWIELAVTVLATATKSLKTRGALVPCCCLTLGFYLSDAGILRYEIWYVVRSDAKLTRDSGFYVFVKKFVNRLCTADTD